MNDLDKMTTNSGFLKNSRIKLICMIIFAILMIGLGFLTLTSWIERRETNIGGFIFAIALLILVLNLIIRGLAYTKMVDDSLRLDLRTFTYSFAGVVFFVEMVLRIAPPDNLRGHNEANGDWNYHSAYEIFLNPCDSCGGRDEYVNQSNGDVEIRNVEFSFRHKYNGYGLRDRQFRHEKDSNEYRILGVGTTADSTWLKQLERKLGQMNNGIKYTTMNGGAHGSDLIFAYELLTRCLLVYKPDLVILDLNSTDLGDVSRAGGDERFDSNGIFHRKTGPWWEFAFGSSYIVRLFALKLFHYDWQFNSPAEQIQEQAIALKNISKKINAFQVLATKNNFKFLLVLQPLYYDLTNSDPYSGLQIDSSIRRVNLYPYFKEKMIVQGEPQDKHYWPIDGHFKSYGYGEMAEEIYRNYFQAH
jgi:ABC-type multidrug transport system fused ATPase/permease subunit